MVRSLAPLMHEVLNRGLRCFVAMPLGVWGPDGLGTPLLASLLRLTGKAAGSVGRWVAWHRTDCRHSRSLERAQR